MVVWVRPGEQEFLPRSRHLLRHPPATPLVVHRGRQGPSRSPSKKFVEGAVAIEKAAAEAQRRVFAVKAAYDEEEHLVQEQFEQAKSLKTRLAELERFHASWQRAKLTALS